MDDVRTDLVEITALMKDVEDHEDGLSGSGDIECCERLGGPLKYYYRKAG